MTYKDKQGVERRDFEFHFNESYSFDLCPEMGFDSSYSPLRYKALALPEKVARELNRANSARRAAWFDEQQRLREESYKDMTPIGALTAEQRERAKQWRSASHGPLSGGQLAAWGLLIGGLFMVALAQVIRCAS